MHVPHKEEQILLEILAETDPRGVCERRRGGQSSQGLATGPKTCWVLQKPWGALGLVGLLPRKTGTMTRARRQRQRYLSLVTHQKPDRWETP